jgi:putative nucleotidyltransferase with HDIG domain
VKAKAPGIPSTGQPPAVRHPPRLVVRALAASFATVGIILTAVFTLISLDVRQRVRDSVIANLEAGQQAAAMRQRERQKDLETTVSLLAENPTLKAALDTWQTERHAGPHIQQALTETMQREADKIAVRTGAHVVGLLDLEGRVVVSAGPRADAWPRGAPLRPRGQEDSAEEFVANLPAGAFRVIGAPLRLSDAVFGSIEFGQAIDDAYAVDLGTLARGHSAVIIGDRVIATTLPAALSAQLTFAMSQAGGAASTVLLGGESYAVSYAADPPATFVTLASIDAAAAGATRSAFGRLASIGAAAVVLAGIGSFWLARTLTRPIDQLSAAVTHMTTNRQFDTSLPATGTSRELDALGDTFNQLIRALAAAEAQTQAAYLGAIRALAAALDARDPYTAGHSERVSTLAVEMGRALVLNDEELDVLRLGALLHDIGKIGVPDEILGKPGALTPSEFEMIRAHPVIGARILRSIPFLAPHLPIVELHHERPDGSGYPYGLIGEAIPLAARIVHVADAYDAITSARAYRPGRLPHEAIAELRRGAGHDFDPLSVQALVKALPRLPALQASFDPMAFQFPATASRRVS